nr:hypothetical protein [uncultured Sphingomonas sp.]
MSRYNREAVDKAIQSVRNTPRVRQREATLIHALLKGRQQGDE